MKRMKRMMLSLLAVVMGTALWAQQLDPAKWTYTVKDLSGSESELVFTAKIDDGWHLYSQYTDPNGPLPLVFEFNKSADYQLVGKVQEPKPHKEMDPMFGCEVSSFSGTVVFRQKVKKVSEKDFSVSGVLSYQMCNNGSCIAPEDHDFSFKVKGAVVDDASDGSVIVFHLSYRHVHVLISYGYNSRVHQCSKETLAVDESVLEPRQINVVSR